MDQVFNRCPVKEDADKNNSSGLASDRLAIVQLPGILKLKDGGSAYDHPVNVYGIRGI